MRPWIYAAKPASWPKLLVPAVLGQALGFAAAGAWSWAGLVLGLTFTLLDALYIVFLNDWGDRQVDAIKRRMFPDGCSPKTIPDGILPARSVLAAGLGAGLGVLVIGAVGSLRFDRPHLFTLALASVLIFQTYTFPPLRLNYRGGGELLETLGVGFVLPLLNAYAQSGLLWHPSYLLLIGFVILSAGSALASGLSDEQSDRAGGKRTFTTSLGNQRVRQLVEGAVILGAGAWVVLGFLPQTASPLVVLPPTVLAVYHWTRVRRASDAAVTNAFGAQGAYKRQLHHAIWRSATLMAVLLLVPH